MFRLVTLYERYFILKNYTNKIRILFEDLVTCCVQGLKLCLLCCSRFSREALQDPLTMSNYAAKFHALLHVEEHQMHIDIQQYNMKAATLHRCGTNHRLLTLEVPGLAENRPSLLKGGAINLWHRLN